MSMGFESKAYESKVLLPEVHGRLVQDLENIARTASIPPQMVWTSMAEYCSKDEMEYVKNLRTRAENGSYGMVYVGTPSKHTVSDRMMAVAGACLRNFTNAKVMTVQDVLMALRSNGMPNPSVLLIPNFFHAANDGGYLPDWQISSLLGMLYSRHAEGLQTFLYVQDWDALRSQYGNAFAMHLEKHFEMTQA